MLTHAQIKRLAGLQDKKARRETGLFVAETPKVAEVMLTAGHIPVREIYALEFWLGRADTAARIRQCERRQGARIETAVISQKELERTSGLKTPQDVVLVAERPAEKRADVEALCRGCSLVLDDIRDPGNLGTILRIADWFAIDHVICTAESADAFQPKCVQASMGSVAVNDIHCLNREEILGIIAARPQLRVYGTFLQGENLYKTVLPQENAWYVIGNEANGIAPDLEARIRHRLTIPPAPKHKPTGAESLNVAVATAILCSQIRNS